VEIPNSVKNGLEIVPVSRMEEVLAHALVRQPQAIAWEESAAAPPPPPPADEEGAGILAH
jgi:ATP-dependent Lon protease